MKHFSVYATLMFVMIVWGLNVVAVKYLVDVMHPVQMQGVRIGAAGIAALAILYVLKELKKPNRKEILLIGAAALFGQVLHHSLLAWGLLNTTAGNASLILGLIPVTTAVFAAVLLRERLNLLRIVGILIGFSGVMLIIIPSNEALSAAAGGDLLIFLSMISQAFSFILIRQASISLPAGAMTAYMLLAGSIVLIGLSFITGGGETVFQPHTAAVWTVFFSSALLATGAGHILFNRAIQKIGPSQTAVFNNFVPFFALGGSWLFLGETITVYQGASFLLIVIGVLLGTEYAEYQYKKYKYAN
ncbi:DMT family transporter [Bacillus daqingensis]|uniref:DMT family transporter n=1 Tax=Bacillus daqingensis TaxID=872396 RepID=A0ABV9NUD3_9BACI